MKERTLVLLKPEAIQRSVCGEIIARFEKKCLKIVGMKMMQITKEIARELHLPLDLAVVRKIGHP